MTEMNLGMTERLKPIHEKVSRMVRDEIIPLDEEFLADVGRVATAGPTRRGRPRSSRA
jgi:acyl-CoA dehydrogenase